MFKSYKIYSKRSIQSVSVAADKMTLELNMDMFIFYDIDRSMNPLENITRLYKLNFI